MKIYIIRGNTSFSNEPITMDHQNITSIVIGSFEVFSSLIYSKLPPDSTMDIRRNNAAAKRERRKPTLL